MVLYKALKSGIMDYILWIHTLSHHGSGFIEFGALLKSAGEENFQFGGWILIGNVVVTSASMPVGLRAVWAYAAYVPCTCAAVPVLFLSLSLVGNCSSVMTNASRRVILWLVGPMLLSSETEGTELAGLALSWLTIGYTWTCAVSKQRLFDTLTNFILL